MHEHEIDLLAIERGIVTAPAGCGKTQLVANALRRYVGNKPILVLTHTNAGVAALRGRLDRLNVPRGAYRLITLDGWSLRVIQMFPKRGLLEPGVLDLENPSSDYPAIRSGALNVLKGGDVDDIVAATYESVIVDEYQDCIESQHDILVSLSRTLKTCALGDPMQAIFGFGGNVLVDWARACEHFPVVGELKVPWRWRNANNDDLGLWLLDVRKKLIAAEPIDLREAPGSVRWIELDGSHDVQRQVTAASVVPHTPNGTVLIIGYSKNPEAQREFARRITDAVTVESVDLKDLVAFARRLKLDDDYALMSVAKFAERVMINVGAADLLKRVEALKRGTARKGPSEVELSAITFSNAPTFSRAADLLVAINKDATVRAHRPTILRAAIRALQLSLDADEASFVNAAVRMREEGRLLGRPLSRRTVGSTLLLKGLEANVSVILDVDQLDAKNLYVALTRGSDQVYVCSRNPIINQKTLTNR